MSRRHRAEKREVIPDPKFKDVVVSKFMSCLMYDGKRSLAVRCKQQLLVQTHSSDLWLIFVPIKRTRMDFMVQKATELGVSKIWPVQSEFGQVKQIREDKLRANMIEAAEQTERLDLPEIGSTFLLELNLLYVIALSAFRT